MIIVSHRGPYTFSEGPDGRLDAKRGAGGVVSALGPLLHGGIAGVDGDPIWIAAAIGPGDRRAAHADDAHLPGVDLVLLDLPADAHRLHYDVVSNEVLWFLHHGLFSLTPHTALGPEFVDAWSAYRSVNRQFADAVCAHASEGDIVFVQDYQLALVPAMVRAARPDLRTLHFTHIPFCDPEDMRVLPEAIAREYCDALAQVTTGFHSDRWRRAYRASAHAVLGEHRVSPSFVTPLGPDPDALHAALRSPEADAARQWFASVAGDRTRIVRTDRVEPTKNLARGFAAYEVFLEQHPEWHDRVTFIACCYRSREAVPLYRTYAAEVQDIVDRVNDRFAFGDWQPIVFDVRDDHARSMVALEQADVTLVNSRRDGLNLVAMEGPTINTRDGVVICSQAAGAYDVMAPGVIGIDPESVPATTDAIAHALLLDAADRRALATTARDLAARHTPQTWLAGCLGALSP